MARAGGTAMDQTLVGAGSTARVAGWIIKDGVDIEANITDDVAETDTTTPGRGGKQRRWHVSLCPSLKGRHRASHGGDGEDCDECNGKRRLQP